MEKKKKKVSKIISAILGGLIILTFVIIMILELILPSNNSFVIWAKENVFDINLIPSGFSEHYKVIIHCLILFVLVLSISKPNNNELEIFCLASASNIASAELAYLLRPFSSIICLFKGV